MSRTIGVAILTALVLWAAPAVAQEWQPEQNTAWNNDVLAGCVSVDACSFLVTESTSPQITSCVRTDFCKICDATKQRCADVTVDASCTCEDVPRPGSPGITTCSEGGQCTYKHVP